MTENLTYRQLSARFPLCNNGLSSNDAWAFLLKKWRDDGKLQEKKHWRWGRDQESAKHNPTRYYDLLKVIRLVVAEQQTGRARPRIGYLCQNYTEEFIDILKPVNPDTEQAITP